jgi:simple sugar transport system ATP-binding protein
MRSVSRRFGPIEALADASLRAYPGEVHALLGENGAGKTTLMRVLCGTLRPDGGEVLVEDRRLPPGGTRAAAAAGIGMVHQHFTLVPSLTVAENVALGTREGSGLRLALDRVHARLAELERVTGLPVDAGAPVAGLSVGAKQRVEILKALYRDPRVLVLDEPTTVLGPQEVDWLFGVLRSLVAEGRTVLLIGHKLDEILRVADRVTVLRRGRTVLEAAREAVDAAALARAMIGREATPAVRAARAARAAGAGAGARVTCLEAAGVRGEDGRMAVKDVTLDVRRGEIVGIGGVEGNGQRELALVLSGRLRPAAGSVQLPATVSLIPQDRSAGGLVPGFDLAENTALAFHDDKAHRRGPLIDWAAMRRTAREIVTGFDVRTPGWRATARSLSGGNRQKLLVGRELARSPDLLVAENPMRGLDIAAAAFLRDKLVELRGGGPDEEEAGGAGGQPATSPPGIVLFSTDLDEVLDLADRVFVLVRGRLIPVPAEERNPAGMGRLMLGSEGA